MRSLSRAHSGVTSRWGGDLTGGYFLRTKYWINTIIPLFVLAARAFLETFAEWASS